MNLPTLIVLIALAGLLAAVLVSLRRKRRCGNGCGNCRFAEGCGRRK